MSDDELVICVREELYQGCVETAKELAHGIQDFNTKKEMHDIIREYEQSY